jgi:hypothetical protein
MGRNARNSVMGSHTPCFVNHRNGDKTERHGSSRNTELTELVLARYSDKQSGKVYANKEYTPFTNAFFAMAVTFMYCRYEYTISDKTNYCKANLNIYQLVQS